MPRRSAADLAVVPPSSPRPPNPPAELGREERDEWKAIVEESGLPARYFGREHYGLLTAYCRHVVSSRRVSKLVEAHEDLESGAGLKRYGKLLEMHRGETKMISLLAQKLRIAHSSRYRGERAVERRTAPAPWQKT